MHSWSVIFKIVGVSFRHKHTRKQNILYLKSVFFVVSLAQHLEVHICCHNHSFNRHIPLLSYSIRGPWVVSPLCLAPCWRNLCANSFIPSTQTHFSFLSLTSMIFQCQKQFYMHSILCYSSHSPLPTLLSHQRTMEWVTFNSGFSFEMWSNQCKSNNKLKPHYPSSQ